MEKFGFAGIVGFAATGLAAAVLGLAAPAQADVIHHQWINDIQPTVSIPMVDTGVHQSR
jgi:hypothetical protein